MELKLASYCLCTGYVFCQTLFSLLMVYHLLVLMTASKVVYHTRREKRGKESRLVGLKNYILLASS